jgi:outer membrane immunogenic protein
MAAPIVAPVYNWTGFYVGAHAGYGWSQVDSTTAFLPSAALFGADTFTHSIDRDGWMLGGQIGFNYQISSWVVGLEADNSWADLNGSATRALTLFGAPTVPASTFRATSDMKWFGTVRGRLGFAANNVLVYVTGGVAFADVDYGGFFRTAGGGGAVLDATGSETHAGWTIGGGGEWGFAPNWSLKAEYLYYDLGDAAISSVAIAGLSIATSFDNDGHILRLGVNYRFGGGPVVARY